MPNIITYDMIKEFLNYDDSFFTYIGTRIKRLDSTKNKDASYFYGTYPKCDSQGVVLDIVVCVPYIIDAQTAFINVHELQHAHDIFEVLGKPLDKSREEYEQIAHEKEVQFKKHYHL